MLHITTIVILIVNVCSTYWTLSSFTGTPTYARSENTQYTLVLNVQSSPVLTYQFNIQFPPRFVISQVNSCKFWDKGVEVLGVLCNVSSNAILLTNLQQNGNAGLQTVSFISSTAIFATISQVTFNILNSTTSANLYTASTQFTTTNAIMNCSLTSTSDVVGNNVTYTLSYTPLVDIYADSILQIQMQPWGQYLGSNFLSNDPNAICNNNCVVSAPSINNNYTETIRYSSLFPSANRNAGSIILNNARNPSSTRPISIIVSLLTRYESNDYSYQTCSINFSVQTPNTLLTLSFGSLSTVISATSNGTLSLQTLNQISSISTVRILPSFLTMVYSYNNYNPGNIVPTLTSTNDSSLLISNLILASATTGSQLMSLRYFRITNPPYANKPVVITVTIENYVSSAFYLVDKREYNLVCVPSVITGYSLTVPNKSINAKTSYSLSFTTVNRLIIGSFIHIQFPSQINIQSSQCAFPNCTILNTTSFIVKLTNVIPPSTNLTLQINNVSNPQTTVPTDSIRIRTFYEDEISFVDEVFSGIRFTAQAVQLVETSVVPSSWVVGEIGNYIVNLKIANWLPAGATMKITIPSSHPSSTISLIQFSINSVAITGCTLTVLSVLVLQLDSSCFISETAALSSIQISLSNVSNPLSFKPTSSWVVETYVGGYLMEYNGGTVSVVMNMSAPLTSLLVSATNNTVNIVTSYKFDVGLKIGMYPGDKIRIALGSGELQLEDGFQCLSNSSGVSLSCSRLSTFMLEIVVSPSVSPLMFLSFTLTSIRNNWKVSNSIVTVETFTNDTISYLKESSTFSISYVAGFMDVSINTNNEIVLLDISNLTVTVTFNQIFNQVTDISKVYLVGVLPIEIEVVGGCSGGGTCSINAGSVNVSGFSSGGSGQVVIKFQVNTGYFNSTSPFTWTLYFESTVMAVNSVVRLSAFCKSPCKKCTSASTECLSCLPISQTPNITYFPITLSCVELCPETYFSYLSTCSLCNQSACYNCTNSPTTCTSCGPNLSLYQNVCYSVCPAGYYSSNKVCEKCEAPCNNCSSTIICTSCVSPFNLDLDGKCVETCKNASYLGINGTCQRCTNNCLTCSSSLSFCLSCENNQYLFYNNTCVRACPVGYYNSDNSSCLICLSPCKTCESSIKCNSCQENYNLYNGETCTDKCPNGTLPIVGKCEVCSTKCSACAVTLGNCTSCSSEYYFYLYDCVIECPPLTYPYQRRCTTCIEPCLTCSSSPTQCRSCSNNLLLLNESCVEVCPVNGYYKSGESCLPCSNKCLSCASVASCSLCSSEYYILNGGCVSECPESHPILENRECKKCGEECESCWGKPNNCTSCAVFYFRYSYTCVKECPLTYYSNVMNYECEDGLSSRIVFFPVLITAFVVLLVVGISKFFTHETSFVTAMCALLSPLELVIWIYVFVQLFTPFKEPSIDYVIPKILFAISFAIFIVLGILFFFFNRRKLLQDDYVVQWAVNNINYLVIQVDCGISMLFGCKFYRIIYSRLFGSLYLSVPYKNRSNAFIPATVATICVFVLCEILAIAASWLLIYKKTLKDQIFYSSVEALVVTIMAVIFSLIDIYKSSDYFEETEFFKQKKYLEKVRDMSTLNKLEEGFEVSHDTGSVDAERFVGTTGGKLFYTKENPNDVKDIFFQEDESQSELTDAVEKVSERSAQKQYNRKIKKINIFGPILEEDEEYYESEKYGAEQISTEAELQNMKRKLKSVGSDDEDYSNKKQRMDDDEFNDNVSMLGDRDQKRKWNDIIDKRKEISYNIFKKHHPNMEQIDEPSIEEDNENSTAKIVMQFDEEFTLGDNTIGDNSLGMESGMLKKKRKKRKLKVKEGNKELEAIYLQRLTDKKKGTKNNLASTKSLKYDF